MKMLFTITYRKQWEDGGYWGNTTTTIKVYGNNLQEAKSKIDEIDPCKFGVYNHILHWEAEEVLNEKEELKDSDD